MKNFDQSRAILCSPVFSQTQFSMLQMIQDWAEADLIPVKTPKNKRKKLRDCETWPATLNSPSFEENETDTMSLVFWRAADEGTQSNWTVNSFYFNVTLHLKLFYENFLTRLTIISIFVSFNFIVSYNTRA